jgi:hypothetical protein
VRYKRSSRRRRTMAIRDKNEDNGKTSRLHENDKSQKIGRKNA